MPYIYNKSKERNANLDSKLKIVFDGNHVRSIFMYSEEAHDAVIMCGDNDSAAAAYFDIDENELLDSNFISTLARIIRVSDEQLKTDPVSDIAAMAVGAAFTRTVDVPGIECKHAVVSDVMSILKEFASTHSDVTIFVVSNKRVENLAREYRKDLKLPPYREPFRMEERTRGKKKRWGSSGGKEEKAEENFEWDEIED